jgi:hypothetical protein
VHPLAPVIGSILLYLNKKYIPWKQVKNMIVDYVYIHRFDQNSMFQKDKYPPFGESKCFFSLVSLSGRRLRFCNPPLLSVLISLPSHEGVIGQARVPVSEGGSEAPVAPLLQQRVLVRKGIGLGWRRGFDLAVGDICGHR